ncbi:HET-domain-containing protein, partial [Coniophora puteana RWD-64-598 SS2]
MDYFQPHVSRRIDRLQLDEIKSYPPSCDDDYIANQIIRKLVQFAILSHRWSRDELSYKDLRKQRGLKGAGWTKLVSFCLEAVLHGMQFAWIDTCCIDKSSSAELDESIRSMFKWYRNSTLCIIYLEQTMSLADMAGDEWFRRGWTLQELLAPERVLFYNKEWDRLTPSLVADDKDPSPLSEVFDIVSEATGIPVQELVKFEPSPREVDQRMTWAAKREVTRQEDAAYSLMGIFDVSISTAYGEGLDRAFCRLVEAIMLSGSDSSVLNWG